jgi:deoxyadenosine/deoxycytidine kinase
MHIAVTGNIGAGKTTLTQRLAQHYGWQVFLEAVEGNPYLADFYDDMERWAFHLQVYFLRSRFEQVLQIREATHDVIQDRTIYEDAYIFARNLHVSGILSNREYATYRSLFDIMMSVVEPPDLMIYLRADLPKLFRQIRQRGRPYEQNIGERYLRALNEHYEEFAATYDSGKLLILDVNELDFANRAEDWDWVRARVEAAIREGGVDGGEWKMEKG